MPIWISSIHSGKSVSFHSIKTRENGKCLMTTRLVWIQQANKRCSGGNLKDGNWLRPDFVPRMDKVHPAKAFASQQNLKGLSSLISATRTWSCFLRMGTAEAQHATDRRGELSHERVSIRSSKRSRTSASWCDVDIHRYTESAVRGC